MATSVDATAIASAAVVSVTQQVAQAVNAFQAVVCENKSEQLSNLCAQCLSAQANEGDVDRSELCAGVCRCNIEDVDMRQVVVVNFTALQQQVSEQQFFQSFMNNLYLQAASEQVAFPGLTAADNVTAIQEQVNKLYNELRSDSVQTALQGLATNQVVQVKGSGLISGLNMTQMVKQVSTVLQSNISVVQTINRIEQLLVSMTTQFTLTTIDLVLVNIIMILAIGLVILLCWEAVKLLLLLL